MSDAAVKKGRWTLLLLAVVFLGPMALAMIMYFTDFMWRPGGTTEHGALYQPPRPLPELTMTVLDAPGGTATLKGKWTLIYVGTDGCDDACRQALVEMRQVRRALGRDLNRVQRLYVADAGSVDRDFLRTEHPGIGLCEDAAARRSITGLAGPLHGGDILLADPLGNLVMRYPAGTTMKAMHEDLRRLLQVSTIG